MQANTSEIPTTTQLISPLDAPLDGGGGGSVGGGGVVDPESASCIPSARGKSVVSGDGDGGVGGKETGNEDGVGGVAGEEAEAMTVTASFMPLMQWPGVGQMKYLVPTVLSSILVSPSE